MRSNSLSKASIGKKVTHELREFAVIALYLWLCFTALVYLKASILRAHDIPFAPFAFAHAAVHGVVQSYGEGAGEEVANVLGVESQRRDERILFAGDGRVGAIDGIKDKQRVENLTVRASEVIIVNDTQTFAIAKHIAGQIKLLLDEIEDARKTSQRPQVALKNAIDELALAVAAPLQNEQKRVLGLLNAYVERLEAEEKAEAQRRAQYYNPFVGLEQLHRLESPCATQASRRRVWLACEFGSVRLTYDFSRKGLLAKPGLWARGRDGTNRGRCAG